MNTLHYIILSGILISLLSISGVALISTSKRLATFVEKNLMSLSALSAGVFLVTSFLLIKETLELLPLTSAVISFGIGIIAYVLLHSVFNHHRHGDSHEHEHQHNGKQAAWKIMIGDTVHNIADGLLLVTSFAFGNVVGFSTTLSIILHEIPQEISEFLVLKKAGYTNKEAAYRNLATASSIFVGIGIGLALINTESIQAYLLGATATFFLGIVFTDLFPIKQVLKEGKTISMLSALILGAAIMSSVSMSLGHSHSHEGDHDHKEHEHSHEMEGVHEEYESNEHDSDETEHNHQH